METLAWTEYLIAQELRFENWTALKRHIAEMTRERALSGGCTIPRTTTES